MASSPPSPGRLRAALGSDAAWIALWSAPLWTSVFGRILKHRTAWFVDFGSVVCAAERLGRGQPLYAPGARCPDVAMSAFVYPPWIAQAVEPLFRTLGARGLMAVYGLVFVAAFGFLMWTASVRPDHTGFAPASEARRLRAPFLAFVAGSPLVVGNVAIVAQAAMVAAALYFGAESAALVVVIVAASLVKPICLTFLAVPAYAAGNLGRRAATIVLAATITTGLVLSDLPGVAAWRAFVIGAAVDPEPGGGLLRWLGDAGVHDHRALAGVYLVYAALVFGAGLAIATRGGLARSERAWLGLSLAVLLLPRVVAYDLLIVGPGLVAAQRAAKRLSPRAGRAIGGLWLAACLVSLVASLAGGALRIGHSVALMLLAAGVVALGAALILRRSTTRTVPAA